MNKLVVKYPIEFVVVVLGIGLCRVWTTCGSTPTMLN